jgi:hypothetical protein
VTTPERTVLVNQSALAAARHLIKKVVNEGDLPEELEQSLEHAASQLTSGVRNRGSAAESGASVQALLDIEEPLKMAIGQAVALMGGIAWNDPEDPLVDAGDALQRTLRDIDSRWRSGLASATHGTTKVTE